MLPKIAILYLCHRDLPWVPDVVDSWSELEYPKDKLAIVMIPNGAKDGVQEYIRQHVLPRLGVDLPEVIMLDDGINRGFSGGNNQGIKWARERGFDAVFLNNGDLRLHPKTIIEAAKMMGSDTQIGSVQSFVCMWKDENVVNTTGGMLHVAGYGYARDNGKVLERVHRKNGEEIMYASGAAVLYRMSALAQVGYLEDRFFMYHEDLELGLRLRFAGYRNVLATESRVFHDYKFGRNTKMFEWMELYRWDVLLAYLKIPSFILLFPLLVTLNVGAWLMAMRGGWFFSKIRAWRSFWTINNMKLIFSMRSRARRLRIIPDKRWLAFMTGRIEDQGRESAFMDFINTIVDSLWRLLRSIIVW